MKLEREIGTRNQIPCLCSSFQDSIERVNSLSNSDDDIFNKFSEIITPERERKKERERDVKRERVREKVGLYHCNDQSKK